MRHLHFGWPTKLFGAIGSCVIVFGYSSMAVPATPGHTAAKDPSVCVVAPKHKLARDAHEPITPLPRTVDLDHRKIGLGHTLFHDVRFSRNNKVSCASCHDISTNGADNKRYSVGWNGENTAVNAPTVFNSGYNFVQYWDGRAATLEEQVGGPIHSPSEMGSDWQNVIEKLGADDGVKRQFSAIYSDGLTAKNIKDAIVVFERSLITPNSRFDEYLRGAEAAITPEEKAGYSLFKSLGCAACHQGRNVGGNLYQRLGIFNNFSGGPKVDKSAMGRFNVTGDERDRHVFKVPSLRNVALTAPYFHDGSLETLNEAVQIMAFYQLGLTLEQNDTNCIVAFLKTLTGARDWSQK